MSRRYVILAIVFNVCLIASNLFETKIFTAGALTLTGGLLIFPVLYIINDCLTEIWGFREARFVILTAFVLNLIVVGLSQIVKILPPAPFWDGQEHFSYIFNADLRITAASMAAFLVGSLTNSLILDKLHRKSSNHEGFGLRAVISTFCGECLDSVIFFPIAFMSFGLNNVVVMMVTQIILKTLYEIIILPFISLLVRRFRMLESNGEMATRTDIGQP